MASANKQQKRAARAKTKAKQNRTKRAEAPVELDPNDDRISSDSPMGMALLGNGPGETVEFDSPSGRKQYKILSIRR